MLTLSISGMSCFQWQVFAGLFRGLVITCAGTHQCCLRYAFKYSNWQIGHIVKLSQVDFIFMIFFAVFDPSPLTLCKLHFLIFIYIIKIGRFICGQLCDWSARSSGLACAQRRPICAGRARAQRGPVKPKTSVASFRLVYSIDQKIENGY